MAAFTNTATTTSGRLPDGIQAHWRPHRLVKETNGKLEKTDSFGLHGRLLAGAKMMIIPISIIAFGPPRRLGRRRLHAMGTKWARGWRMLAVGGVLVLVGGSLV